MWTSNIDLHYSFIDISKQLNIIIWYVCVLHIIGVIFVR